MENQPGTSAQNELPLKKNYTTLDKEECLGSYTSLFDEKELVVAFREREIFISMFLRRVCLVFLQREHGFSVEKWLVKAL